MLAVCQIELTVTAPRSLLPSHTFVVHGVNLFELWSCNQRLWWCRLKKQWEITIQLKILTPRTICDQELRASVIGAAILTDERLNWSVSLIWRRQWRDDLLGETSWRNRTLDDPSFYPDSESYRSFMSKMFLFFVPSRVPLPHYHHPPPPAMPLSIFLNISCQDYISKRDVRCPKFISFSRFAIIESQFHQSQAIRGTSIWIESCLSVCPLENASHFLPFSSRKSKIMSTICDFIYHGLLRLR